MRATKRKPSVGRFPPARSTSSSAAVLEPEEQHDWLTEAQHIGELYEPPDTGRPGVLTDTYRINKLLRLVAGGNYVGTAFIAAGFSRQHKCNWEAAAKDGNLAAIALFDAIEKAEAFAESESVANVKNAGKLPQFWAAAATHLERRHPEKWGKRQDDSSVPRVVVQIGVGSGDVQVRLADNSVQPLAQPLLEQGTIMPIIGPKETA